MSKSFDELRERLLRAGVAPRHVRRYLKELAEHLADLTEEEECAGHGRADAESAALIRLGGMDELAQAMIERREFQSWCVRAPWAMFGFAPLLFLAGAYFVALFILWTGWMVFVPGADTPFGIRAHGFANLYFQTGKFLYYSAPVLVGWGIGFVAARQRLKPGLKLVWPAAGLIVIALMGSAARVHAGRAAVPGWSGHIRMSFAFGSSLQATLIHVLTMLLLMAAPLLIWRLQRAHVLT
jgi:hypothetical protein